MSVVKLVRARAAVLISLALVGAAACSRGGEQAGPPNFVFIMADDQGPWTLSSGGDPNSQTPHLDRLRSEGALLTHCYSPTPVCSPARAAVLTSRYGTEVGITDYLPASRPELNGLDPSLPTWPRSLSEAGYRTALIGKWHLGSAAQSHPTRLGYGEFTGFIHGGMTSLDPSVEIDGRNQQVQGYTPDILSGYAIDFMRRAQDEPFALSLHFWAPHANSAALHTTADGDRTWLPLSPADWDPFKNLQPEIPEPGYPDLDIPRNERMMREYLGSVHSLDRNVGRLLDELDKLDLTGRSVVIFTSDHGFNMGHHGIWHKGNGRLLLRGDRGDRPNLWETSLGVPALVRAPGLVEPGAIIDQTLTHLDWFPTILALAGVSPPAGAVLRGRNFLPLLKGDSARWDNDLFAEYRMRSNDGDGADMRSYRAGDWKLIRFLRHSRPNELYNLANDPGERNNLIASSEAALQEVIATLDGKLRDRMREIGDAAPAGLAAATN